MKSDFHYSKRGNLYALLSPFLFLPTSRLLPALCHIILFCIPEYSASVLCLEIDSKNGKLVDSIWYLMIK